MKKLIAILAIGTISGNLYSQEKSKSDIQLPSSPGMSIIGLQSNEISKPGNYTGLYSSLISPIVSNNGTIPNDLSIEFSPYYLVSRDVTINEINRTNLYRDLKFSIASTSVVNADSTTFTRMGVGFKTNLLSGNLSVISKDTFTTVSAPNDIETVIFMVNENVLGDLDTAEISNFTIHIQKSIDRYNEEDNNSKANQFQTLKREVEKILKSNKNSKNAAITKLSEYRKKIEKLVKVDDSRWNYALRTGSFLELAGAVALDFPENKFNYSIVNRWGFWLNYTYRPNSKNKNLDLGTIFRVSNYSFDPTVVFENQAIFSDLGASITFKVPDTKFSVAGEYVGKLGFSELKTNDPADNEFTFKNVTENKWNLSIGYEISDNVIWNMSLSEIKGNSDYLNNGTMQFLMGISAALIPMKK